MKIYLDDERDTPEGWVRAYTPKQVTDLLSKSLFEEVECVSLDHDLGDDHGIGTGYDVLLWVEERLRNQGILAPRMSVHSMNSAARQRMNAGLQAVERYQDIVEPGIWEDYRLADLAREYYNSIPGNIPAEGYELDFTTFSEEMLEEVCKIGEVKQALLHVYEAGKDYHFEKENSPYAAIHVVNNCELCHRVV